MRKLIISIMATVFLTGTVSAFQNYNETNRMENGIKFAEQQTEKTFNSKSSPVEIGELSAVNERQCNTKAKNYNKLTTKTPPTLKKTEADKKSKKKKWTPLKVGMVVGGIAGAVIAAPMIGSGIAIATCAVAVPSMIIAGAAIVGGIIHFGSQIGNHD